MAYSENTDWNRAEIRKRGTAIAIALLLEALLIIAIISLSMQSTGAGQGKRGLSAFSLEAGSESAAADKSDTEALVAKTPRQVAAAIIPKSIMPPVNPLRLPPPSPDFIKVSKSEFDAMDISKLPASGSSGAGETKGSGQGDKGMMGPGLGPGGAQLYPVAWLREPYDSELSPYFASVKRFPPGASADIACRMAEQNRVENCQIIGESPRGTGLARRYERLHGSF